MSIRNLHHMNSSRVNFNELYGVLPDKLGLTDVDGACEYKHQFFFLEAKRHGTSMPRGQELFFERLITRLGGLSVLVLWEYSQDHQEATVCPHRDCLRTKTWVYSTSSGKALGGPWEARKSVRDELALWVKGVDKVYP